MNNEELLLSELPDIKGRYVVIDTETTGLNYLRDHIISVAGIEVVNGRLSGNQFHGYLQPRVYIGEDAIKIHKLGNNFYNEYFKDTYKSDAELLKSFRDFIGDSIIFAHNALFDYHFLFKDFKHFSIPSIDKSKMRCTMKLFKKVFSETDTTLKAKNKLSNCCKYIGLKIMNEDYHSAIFDAFMCARLLIFIYDFRNKNSLIKTNDKMKTTEDTNINSIDDNKSPNKVQLKNTSNNDTKIRSIDNQLSGNTCCFDYEDYTNMLNTNDFNKLDLIEKVNPGVLNNNRNFNLIKENTNHNNFDNNNNKVKRTKSICSSTKGKSVDENLNNNDLDFLDFIENYQLNDFNSDSNHFQFSNTLLTKLRNSPQHSNDDMSNQSSIKTPENQRDQQPVLNSVSIKQLNTYPNSIINPKNKVQDKDILQDKNTPTFSKADTNEDESNLKNVKDLMNNYKENTYESNWKTFDEHRKEQKETNGKNFKDLSNKKAVNIQNSKSNQVNIKKSPLHNNKLGENEPERSKNHMNNYSNYNINDDVPFNICSEDLNMMLNQD